MSDHRPTGWGGDPVQPPDLEEVTEAAGRIEGLVVRTPLMPLHSYDAVADIYLKPEVLQPVGSFKIRGVGNWALSLSDEERRRGIATTSAGNTAMALGTWADSSGCRHGPVFPTPFTSRNVRRSPPMGSISSTSP